MKDRQSQKIRTLGLEPSRAVANATTTSAGSTSASLGMDVLLQRKRQELADSSQRVAKQMHYQNLANTGFSANQPIQKKENNTGLPDNLKAGIENLSGYSMDDVKVHYSSDKPAQLNAHAYAQRTDIHLGPGQEKHLPHEAWHVVQQKQGRVKPTLQMKNKAAINDDEGLEREADIMGLKASVTSYTIQPKVEFGLNKDCRSKTGIFQLTSRKTVADPRPRNALDVMPTVSFREYADHVRLRTTIFFKSIMTARKLVMEAGSVPHPELFTNHAAIQTGQGMRGQPGRQNARNAGFDLDGEVPKSENIDAAHRVNTSFIPEQGMALGMLEAHAMELYELTAGTSQQFQVSNITSDKTIDAVQTDLKNDILSGMTDATSPEFVAGWLHVYLTECKNKLEPQAAETASELDNPTSEDFIKARSYQMALEVTNEQLADFQGILQEIMTEVNAVSNPGVDLAPAGAFGGELASPSAE